MYVNIKEQSVGVKCRAKTILIRMSEKRANRIVGNTVEEKQINGHIYYVFHNTHYYPEGYNSRYVLVDFAQCVNFQESSSHILHNGGSEVTLPTNSGWYHHIEDVLIPKEDITESVRQLRDKIYESTLKERNYEQN